MLFWQVVGLTASLGVGNAKASESAEAFILQKCANMDAREITVVRKHMDELAKYNNIPEESKRT